MSAEGSPSSITTRQSKLRQALKSSDLDGLVLNPGPSLTYLTGLHFHLMERPIVVIFTPDDTVFAVIPKLEAAKLKDISFPINAFYYGEDPASWPEEFGDALEATDLLGEYQIGVEPSRLRLLELRYLENAAPKGSFVSAEQVLSSLRMYKDANEIKAMRKAAHIAQEALSATLPSISVGASEKEIASELTSQLLCYGSESNLPFFPIVASGPNSANPHATPTDRVFSPGDMLVIDWGATYHGYVSDITRTFAIGEVEDELIQIYEAVARANEAGRQVAKPGVTAGSVDAAARQVIESAGYAKFFTHRTGHGLGMEGHERPYIRAGNKLPLAPGMTFTVEPGIYLPNRNGVRIEDDVVITEDGSQSLTDFPRHLQVLG
ncbi:MAG: Xaa-Pro peptidase family protein [Anaerolineales bacterium]